jgi:hypothetical protein
MNVEDSYEGAVRRLQRLETASYVDRMRELEELATLACEDNERLKGELDAAQREIEQLRGHVASLQQQAASPQQAFAPAPSPFAADTSLDEDCGYPPKSSGKGARYFFLVAIAGAGIAALFVMRPWERPRPAPIVVEQPTPPAPPPPAPVVTAPKPAPKIEPTVPKVEPTIPKAVPVAAHEPRVAKTRSERKHAKHHAAKKHGSAKSKEAALDTSDDPLGGTGL